jgi:sulfhydrogenase subunit alpha
MSPETDMPPERGPPQDADARRQGASLRIGTRRLSVKALTRVEGEGALRVRIVDGRVEIAEFNIYEPPRFFERLLVGRGLEEVPDITARICGICPVAYQMSACHALERALGIVVTPGIARLRRLLYCGEWIQSHALHLHLLHAPDFLGLESGLALATEHREFLERGLRMKAVGNRLLEVVGGRAVHPVNVAVGGFHRAVAPGDVAALVPELEWGLGAAIDLVAEVAAFPMPPFDRRPTPQPVAGHGATGYRGVCLRHDRDYPMNHGRIVSSDGLDIAVDDYERHFRELQVPHSTALASVMIPGDRTYLTGPVARITLCHDRLPPRARAALSRSRLPLPITNPFASIVARAVEIAAAFEEALAIAGTLSDDIGPCRVAWRPRDGVGCHATEAPRGLLYHRYDIGVDGLVKRAVIVPPTAQNQRQIEEDLLVVLQTVLDADDALATARCEALIRSYDPCISCATHFLDLRIDRGRAGTTVPPDRPGSL